MKKLLLIMIAFTAGTFLAGCAKEEGIPYVYREPPTHYWTVHEALEMIQPVMLEWNEDAFVVRVASPLRDSRPEWGIQHDGKVPVWSFTVVSPSAQKYTAVLLVNELTSIGMDGHPEKNSRGNSVPLPIERFIGSDKMLLIARKVSGGLQPIDIETRRVSRPNKGAGEEILLAWELRYNPPEGGTATVYIDATTGEVIRNDFLIPQDG